MRWVIVLFVTSYWNSHYSHEGRLINLSFDLLRWLLTQILFGFDYLILHNSLSSKLLFCYSSHLAIVALFSIAAIGSPFTSLS